MGLSKRNKILILLVIDTAFFLLELTAGYAVHSLALVADAFHMLNDVLSLLVGLWAVDVANQETSDKMYTYGWQRAETLGALVNGVFLVALCLSIFLEAIQRLVEPQEVTNPQFICVVGCLGLLSNILGLVLFHDHSHGHGHGHGHDHSGEDIEDVDAAEQGHAGHKHGDHTVADKRVSLASHADSNTEPASPFTRSKRRDLDSKRSSRRWSGSTNRALIDPEDIPVLPALRRPFIAAGLNQEQLSESESDQREGDDRDEDTQPSERSPLLGRKDRAANYTDESDTPFKPQDGTAEDDIHKCHNHSQPKEQKDGHGHGHGHDLNMRGVFLHVMGDALGNIGVIVAALFIWLTNYSWRFYVDPGISLIITCIILCSAIPLCKAASRILLQAVPPGMSIDHIKEDIERLPGVIGSHHLHVWQLSDTKIVASIHIQVDTEIKGEGSERYMRLARQVRKCLHAYGIHSSTIQPEFAPDSDVEDNQAVPSSSRGSNDDTSGSSKHPSRAASVGEGDPQACLLECGEECAQRGQCCPKKSS